MQIIPAIDIFQGKCVRLEEGIFARRTEYPDDPQVTAQRFASSGAKYLHIVDLEGAKEGRILHWNMLEKILSGTKLDVQVGGGVRTVEDVQRLLNAGASRVIVGSVAIRSPEKTDAWCRQFGADKFCVALDTKDSSLLHGGWQEKGEQLLKEVVVRIAALGVRRFLATDVRRDGMLAGPNLKLYADLVQEFPHLEWVASGGVRSSDDILALDHIGLFGVIIGKALYNGTLLLEEAINRSC